VRDVRQHHGVQLTPARGRACGKAILLGEHFVVHGAPAIAVPILGRGVTVTLAPEAEAGASSRELEDAVRAMLARLGRELPGVRPVIHADLPIAAGLGSSAALAVALVRALGEVEPARVQALAHDLERLAHGHPSGIDDAVISHARAIWFERAQAPDAPPRIEPLDVALPPLWVATVSRTRSTRDAVLGVASWREANASAFEALVTRVRALAQAARAALIAGDQAALGRLMDDAQACLEPIGVVDPRHATIVAHARAAGALGAKTTGAGHGGAVLVLAPAGLDLAPVLRAAGAEEVFFAGPAPEVP